MGKKSRKHEPTHQAAHQHHKTGQGTHHHHHLYSGSHSSHHGSSSGSFHHSSSVDSTEFAGATSNTQAETNPNALSGSSELAAEHTDNDNNDNSNTFEDQPSAPFFADAMLDLETAHDIADTPDAATRTLASIGNSNNTSNASINIANNANNNSPSCGRGGGGITSRRLDMPDVPLGESEGGEEQHAAGLDPPSGLQAGGGCGSGPSFLNMELGDDAAELILDDDDDMGDNHNNNPNNRKSSFARITSSIETTILPPPQHRPPFPRDLPWAISFAIFCPISLTWPIVIEEHADQDKISPLVRSPLSVATLHALGWAALAGFILIRLLYRTQAGPEGEDARYQICQVLAASTALSVAVYTCLFVAVWVWLPEARYTSVIPLWFTLQHIFLVRAWRRRGDRQAFFQALASMALDLLSKSLRRASFFRVLSLLLIWQVGVLVVWRWALLGALGSRSWLILAMAVVGGKWATGTTARLLSLIASGGVMNWFVEQSAAVAALPETPRILSSSGGDNDDPLTWTGRSSGGSNDMPEAYRTVDASVYQSVMMEADNNVLDDDEEYDGEDFWESPSSRRRAAAAAASEPKYKSTVKSLLAAGLTVSFGSVVQCGLVGGLAQFVWSQLRKVDAAQSVWARLRERHQGFSSMQIGGQSTATDEGAGGGMARGRRTLSLVKQLWIRCVSLAREFVRGHSDLAMAFVAAYYKNYVKAAKEVAALVDQSGVEPILHDDITTHMCASIGGSVSGVIVIFSGYVLLQARRSSHNVSDFQVFEDMLLAFILCYTLIFTVMEPLRASIKAVYVGFAQHPQSLSQAYPLIYQRLRRLSESNVS